MTLEKPLELGEGRKPGAVWRRARAGAAGAPRMSPAPSEPCPVCHHPRPGSPGAGGTGACPGGLGMSPERGELWALPGQLEGSATLSVHKFFLMPSFLCLVYGQCSSSCHWKGSGTILLAPFEIFICIDETYSQSSLFEAHQFIKLWYRTFLCRH